MRLQKDVTEQMLKATEGLSALARDRLRVGNGDEYEVAIAQANVESLRDTARSLDLAYQNALRALEALLGRYPAASIGVAERLPQWAGDVPAGVPSDLLERRPDVVAAERRVAVAFYRTEEAKAARLPRITLVANFTSLSSELFVLQSRDNPVFSAGAALMQPIFLGGLLQAQVDARTAEQKAAIADYGKVGLRAFAEVEGALAGAATAGEREQILERAERETTVRSSSRTSVFASARSIFAPYSSSSLRSTPRASRCCASRPSALVQRVNLHLALGGSFDVPSAAVASDAGTAPR